MIGDTDIDIALAGTEAQTAKFAAAFNKLVSRANRKWTVRVDNAAGPNQNSVFIGSDTDVELVLRGLQTGGGETMVFRVNIAGTAQDVAITSASIV